MVKIYYRSRQTVLWNSGMVNRKPPGFSDTWQNEERGKNRNFVTQVVTDKQQYNNTKSIYGLKF